MKKQISFWIILGLIILLLVGIGIYLFFQDKDNQGSSQIANPASVYCINQSGTLEIRTASDGSQVGYCLFKNGKECEEWQFFRGECTNE